MVSPPLRARSSSDKLFKRPSGRVSGCFVSGHKGWGTGTGEGLLDDRGGEVDVGGAE